MSLMDTLKGWVGKGKQTAAQHRPQTEAGIDKGGKLADDRTGGKYTDKIEKGKDAAKRSISDE